MHLIADKIAIKLGLKGLDQIQRGYEIHKKHYQLSPLNPMPARIADVRNVLFLLITKKSSSKQSAKTFR
jgi:hypothetical protein